jgi:serine/threonine-protein kinase
MSVAILFKGHGMTVPLKIRGTNGKDYTLQEQIGTGGNAVVCECADEIDGSVHAVKFFMNSRDRIGLPRFQQEAKLLEELSHANHAHLIRFITNGSVHGTQYNARKRRNEDIEIPFVVMELANCSLREFIGKSREAIAPEIYVAQFRGLVGALELLHGQAIHRDIKPDNILVIGERWLISDFGLCSMIDADKGLDLTEKGRVVGPRFWMSPEANNRNVGLEDEIGVASDVFQLASVFWWVVNRRHPTGILTREDWVGADELYSPITKALQHSMSRRFQSASEFGEAVRTAISS